MKKLAANLLFLLVAGVVLAQSAIWRDVSRNSLSVRGRLTAAPPSARTVQVNKKALLEVLARAPMEFTKAAKATVVVLEIPKPDGSVARFRIEESPMISGAAAKERPDWKTYAGRGIDDPTAVARFSWSREGFRGYVLGREGTYYVDPYSSGDTENYVVYFKHDLGGDRGSFHCGIDRYLAEREAGTEQLGPIRGNAVTPNFSTGASLRTYRVAIATTGEYTVVRGGQAAALTDVMNAINRINTVYRRDAAISLTLVSGTNTVFPDPNTDPYNNTDDGAQLTINQTQLDNIIGTANYDLGHLFGTGGGGIASSPSVCSPQKAEGYSARGPNSTGDPFWVDYVAHEMGHQFGADHTYNTLEMGGCSTRSATDAYEPASGTTIMGYVGVCGQRNLQTFSIDNFHIRSLTSILNEVATGGGSTCGMQGAANNAVPTVNAGANFTIPKMTPFTLTATGMDADNDPLTYSWEEYDLAAAPSGPNGMPAGTYDVDSDNVFRPLFRALPPTASASRTFPRLTYILNNANDPPLTYMGTSPAGDVCPGGDTCVTGEKLSAITTGTRTMNFRVCVRDGKGGVADAGMQVVVDSASGPFAVTSPNTAVTATGGMPFNVTWAVANTTAAPVSAANVKISLSTDGGMTFPTVLNASTLNDGMESITMPNVNTTTARIKVEAVGNIFFDISDANFTITGGGPTPTPSKLANISTRLRVEGGDNVPIAGFIVTGTANKRVIVRALGPSLNVMGMPLPGRVSDTTLELVGPGGTIAMNDDWRSTQEADIIASMVPPPSDLESAIIADLPASAGGTAYTAVVRGKNGATGVGQVEVYDLANAVDSQLANISTRGLVQTGDDVMIGGIILLGPNPRRVIVRAIGPSLSVMGTPLPGRLMDTTLEIRDANGMLEGMNDDWRSTQEAEIIATMVPPTSDLESAIVATLPASTGGTSHTAIVRGKNNTTGVGLVEAFGLN